MIVVRICLLMLVTVPFAGICAEPLADDEVSVLRTGREALVRTKFSESRDLIVVVQRGANEDAYLVDRDTPTAAYKKGTLIHVGADDFTPFNIAGFGYIGGNHGSCYGQLQTVTNHGFTTSALGMTVTNSARFGQCLIAIPDKDHLLLHPGAGKGPRPYFAYDPKGPFFGGGRSWTPEKVSRVQVYPMNRFSRFRWQLPSGEEVPEGVETRAADVTLAMEHDVLDPRGLVEYCHDHPGQPLDPAPTASWSYAYPDAPVSNAAGRAAFKALPALARVSVDYVYRPGCARLVRRRASFPQPLKSVVGMDVMYMWRAHFWKDISFYVPRVKPVTLRGVNGGTNVTVNLQAVASMKPAWKATGGLPPASWTDQQNPPDRYIRLMDNGKDKVGVVLGYSLVDGASALGRPLRPRDDAYYFYVTDKMYPTNYTLKDIPAGTEIETWSYTQYFDRAQEPDATAFFQHREGKDEIVYFDCHRTLADKRLNVGKRFAGRRIEVLEKTPSVTLKTSGKVATDGTIVVDVADGYGTLVVRVKGIATD